MRDATIKYSGNLVGHRTNGGIGGNGGKWGKWEKLAGNGGKWGEMENNGGKWKAVRNTSWKMYENVPTGKKNGGKWCRNGGHMSEK